MLERYRDSRFGPGDVVRLDQREYINCVFNGCELEFRGEGGGGIISNCRFEGQFKVCYGGFASAVLQRLGILARGADMRQSQLVRQLFNCILSNCDAMPLVLQLHDELARHPQTPELIQTLRGFCTGGFEAHFRALFDDIMADAVPHLDRRDPGDSHRVVAGVKLQQRYVRAPLYKFAMAEHAERLVKQGEFWINTLSAIRLAEASGSIWGDAGEGTRRVSFQVDHVMPSSRLTLARQPEGASDIGALTVVNSTITEIQVVEDAPIYCLSMERSEELMKYFGYNACIEIIDPSRLFDDLTVALASNLLIGAFAAVRYGSKDVAPASLADNPVLYLKDQRFEREKEVRASWQLKPGATLAPHRLVIPGARDYVKRVI
jgi:hypothetical protein